MSSSWVSSAQIKVTSEQLSSKAAQVKIKINNIKSKISELEDSVRMTETYWKGEANNTYRAKYNEFKDSTDEIIRRLEEHVRDLNTMAGVYEEAENENIRNVAEDLNDNVIF